MLHHKFGLHAEACALLDGEGLALELLDGAGRGQVDGDVGATIDFETERLDYAATLVGGVDGDAWRVGDAERSLPAFEGFIVLIWVRKGLFRLASQLWDGDRSLHS